MRHFYFALLFWTLISTEFTSCDDVKKVYNVKIYLDSNKNPTTATSCQDAEVKSLIRNGKATLEVPDYPDPFYVSCIEDPEDGPAWTLIQRRQNGHVDFNRDWIDYVTGFGDVGAEHFIGLAKQHAMTKFQPQELWIELEYFDGNRTFAKYDSFAIGDKESNYALTDLGAYSGTAGDALSRHRGQPFSTRDADHDSWQKGNCAKEYKGGWWFLNCLDSNLNGQYHGNGVTPTKKWAGVYWYDLTDYDLSYSLKYTHMAIRPKNAIKNIFFEQISLPNPEYIPEYPITRVPEYPSTRVPEYPSIQVPAYPSTRVPEYNLN